MRHLLMAVAVVHCGHPADHAVPSAPPSHPSVRVWTLDELRAGVTPESSNLVAYHLTGASWVEGQPILVNRDFDFGVAMGLEGIGPAIAAGNRTKANDEIAASLARLPPMETQKLLAAAVDACGTGCDFWGSAPVEVALYGLLYGGMREGATSRLQTILEIHPNPRGDPLRLIVVSEARSLEGENGWLSANGTAVSAEFESATNVLVSATTHWWINLRPKNAEEFHCPIGDGEKLSGHLVDRLPGYAVAAAKDIPDTLVICPAP